MWLIIIGLLVVNQALASDSWLCTEEASQVVGSHVQACGVGEAPTESAARMAAFHNAKLEFDTLCDARSACSLHQYLIMPKRMSCQREGDGWKCYRLLEYTMLKALRPRQAVVMQSTADDDEIARLNHAWIVKEMKANLNK